MRTRFPSRVRNDRRGQALVEFAFALPILVLFFLAIFEFSRHYYTRLNVRNAVAEAARFAATGRQLPDPDTGEMMSRAESIVEVMRDRARGLQLDVDRVSIDPADGGGPDDIVQIRATYRYDFMTIPLVRTFAPPFAEFTVATTFKNEPVF